MLRGWFILLGCLNLQIYCQNEGRTGAGDHIGGCVSWPERRGMIVAVCKTIGAGGCRGLVPHPQNRISRRIKRPVTAGKGYAIQGKVPGAGLIKIVPWGDLLGADKNAYRPAITRADIADDLFGSIGQAMEVARVLGGLDTEDRADVFGIVLHDLPPLVSCLGQRELFDPDGIFDAKLYPV